MNTSNWSDNPSFWNGIALGFALAVIASGIALTIASARL